MTLLSCRILYFRALLFLFLVFTLSLSLSLSLSKRIFMCSGIHQFSSFLRSMSGSADKQQIFPIKGEDDREGILKPESSSQPVSENPGSSSPEIASQTETVEERKGILGRADHHQKELEEIKEEEETDKATVSRTESEKQVPEDDDGFKTPTSSDHRIPAIMQCPPAPKKPRPQPSKLKRKASPTSGSCRSIQLDASTAEVESIFRPINPNDQDDTQEQKSKKARRDNTDDS